MSIRVVRRFRVRRCCDGAPGRAIASGLVVFSQILLLRSIHRHQTAHEGRHWAKELIVLLTTLAGELLARLRPVQSRSTH